MAKKCSTKTSIGGQAVLEGVMMKSPTSMAIAVRDADGVIRLETKRTKPVSSKSVFFRLPIIRGIVAFLTSLIEGSAILMRSAEVYGEGEPSKFEKWLSEKLKINLVTIVTVLGLVLGLGLAVFLFMWLPQFLRSTLEYLINIEFGVWAKNFIEGGLKLLVFICYILLCSILKDIRRTFMYHGAEHKTISCYEKGLPLTVENAKSCTRIHDRCGTSFIVLVLLTSIIAFACFESLVGTSLQGIVRVLCKVAVLPLVAGFSYEILKALAKTNSKFFIIFKWPGMLLQRITTKEPEDNMLEVAITAFNAVLELDSNPNVKEVEFVVAKKRNLLVKEVAEKLNKHGIEEYAEAEWIVSLTINCKRDELNKEDIVNPSLVEKINKIVEERITGRPLWYCIGDTEFYGYTIKVDERVLIPRPETELLVENALKHINENSTVLDLCTGSGAIAIAVKKESNASVCAIDISKEALDLAKENAKLNNAEIEFIESDLFNEISKDETKKFNVIISNPPYIKTEDIKSLQKEVKGFEPNLALDGGNDGYDFYRIICYNAKNYLTENGVLLLECGLGQAEEIKSMLIGYSSVEIIKDYENIERIVKAVL